MFPTISAIEIQNPIVDYEHENESDLFTASARLSQDRAVIREKWNSLSMAAMEVAASVNPYIPDLPIGSVILAVEAASWIRQGVDIRPRLKDSSTGKFRMIDTGSQITATCKGPGDKLDNSVKLVAVNGSRIDTYGIRKIEVKIENKLPYGPH